MFVACLLKVAPASAHKIAECALSGFYHQFLSTYVLNSHPLKIVHIHTQTLRSGHERETEKQRRKKYICSTLNIAITNSRKAYFFPHHFRSECLRVVVFLCTSDRIGSHRLSIEMMPLLLPMPFCLWCWYRNTITASTWNAHIQCNFIRSLVFFNCTTSAEFLMMIMWIRLGYIMA